MRFDTANIQHPTANIDSSKQHGKASATGQPATETDRPHCDSIPSSRPPPNTRHSDRVPILCRRFPGIHPLRFQVHRASAAADRRFHSAEKRHPRGARTIAGRAYLTYATAPTAGSGSMLHTGMVVSACVTGQHRVTLQRCFASPAQSAFHLLPQENVSNFRSQAPDQHPSIFHPPTTTNGTSNSNSRTKPRRHQPERLRA